MKNYLDLARTIVETPRNHSAWNEVIVQNKNHDYFFWTDEVEFGLDGIWNKRFSNAETKFPNVSLTGEYPEMAFHYKGNTVSIPLVEDREDNMIMILALNHAVKADTEIRYCIDSSGSSDIAFLAMPTKDWRKLEEQFGREAVAYQFLALPHDVEDFLEAVDNALETRDQALLTPKSGFPVDQQTNKPGRPWWKFW